LAASIASCGRACAEHIVPKTVKLYCAAPATTVNFDVVPALIAVWQTSREARCCMQRLVNIANKMQ
jgi:hypothetical protein